MGDAEIVRRQTFSFAEFAQERRPAIERFVEAAVFEHDNVETIENERARGAVSGREGQRGDETRQETAEVPRDIHFGVSLATPKPAAGSSDAVAITACPELRKAFLGSSDPVAR